jgi:hypothetical protein
MTGGKSMKRAWSPESIEKSFANIEKKQEPEKKPTNNKMKNIFGEKDE